MGAMKRVRITGAVGLCLLCAPLVWLAWARPAPRPHPAVASPFGAPLRGRPFDETLREARRWHAQARLLVVRDREALTAWDPESAKTDTLEVWRQQMAHDRGGCLRRARTAAQRAAELAATREEEYRVTALRALLECDTGHHEAELRHARQLITLAPQKELSLLWLRRAGRCNRLQALERQTNAALLRPGQRREPAAGEDEGTRDGRQDE